MKTESPIPKTLSEAIDFIAGYIEAFPSSVEMPLADATGHVLAQDLTAPANLPRFDNAAMDGFAVRSADLAGGGTGVQLRIVSTIAAGQTGQHEIGPGEAARITTGAMMPKGADRVVMQENARLEGNQVRLFTASTDKAHIRRAGDDIAQSDLILEAGTIIGPGQIILLAALGFQSVSVTPKPKVALLSTGDELRDAPAPLIPGQIYDSNRPMLSMMLKAAGAEISDLGIIGDDPDHLLRTLVGAAGDHDLIISSGGASAGFADHLTRAVSQRGHLEFWKLDMRPGKPIGFGDVDHCPILILPGNPLAAAAGCAVLGRPLVHCLAGRKTRQDGWLRLPVSRSFSKPLGRTHILPGRLVTDPSKGMTIADPLPERGSASLHTLSQATVLIMLAGHQANVDAGDVVDVLPLWQA
ncbi:molybdopterin molybdotransferase MoeA [Neorhizobium alkalisoli]|uniref:Molybdopterin molybdenumtransferase n=1 Tax=Neorhizobium alkalisoli TaxID=528178 RepID=A0A561R8B5_9HYPH|nr:gephyrin-like molybdotransferase Glp [Neorhizobium alkalisoli]TWF58849.1 molybdopterin molybdochelatase [Neorhizobium alkalisoli]